MRPPNKLKTLTIAFMAAALALASTVSSAAEKRVRWKMQSAFSSTLVHLGPGGLKFAANVDRMSSGRFQIKFFEPGALVPALECFDAVSKGSIESCWTTPGYHAGKIPAVQFFTTVPFGPQLGEFLAWKYHGGGNALRDEIYGEHNLKSVDASCIGPETSGWFKKPINSL
jgi:TRAP-type mannitol/chloroaromatic compound transport system substrate-binding protein